MLGDEATVASINPPDGSAQASHCARFFPIVRDALLEMHTWGFATTRATLTLLATNPTTDPFDTTKATWQYAYAAPSDVVNYLEILDPASVDEYSVGVQMANTVPGSPNTGLGNYVPQPFEIETDASGNDVVLTNLQYAQLRYTKTVTDTTKFTPLFTEAFAMLLASHLAGPLIKGSEGRATAKDFMTGFFKWWGDKAMSSDANQRRVKLTPGAPWMVNR